MRGMTRLHVSVVMILCVVVVGFVIAQEVSALSGLQDAMAANVNSEEVSTAVAAFSNTENALDAYKLFDQNGGDVKGLFETMTPEQATLLAEGLKESPELLKEVSDTMKDSLGGENKNEAYTSFLQKIYGGDFTVDSDFKGSVEIIGADGQSESENRIAIKVGDGEGISVLPAEKGKISIGADGSVTSTVDGKSITTAQSGTTVDGLTVSNVKSNGNTFDVTATKGDVSIASDGSLSFEHKNSAAMVTKGEVSAEFSSSQDSSTVEVLGFEEFVSSRGNDYHVSVKNIGSLTVKGKGAIVSSEGSYSVQDGESVLTMNLNDHSLDFKGGAGTVAFTPTDIEFNNGQRTWQYTSSDASGTTVSSSNGVLAPNQRTIPSSYIFDSDGTVNGQRANPSASSNPSASANPSSQPQQQSPSQDPPRVDAPGTCGPGGNCGAGGQPEGTCGPGGCGGSGGDGQASAGGEGGSGGSGEQGQGSQLEQLAQAFQQFASQLGQAGGQQGGEDSGSPGAPPGGLGSYDGSPLSQVAEICAAYGEGGDLEEEVNPVPGLCGGSRFDATDIGGSGLEQGLA